MIEQLLSHLIGDYVFSVPFLAVNKGKKFHWALVHALLYVIPFVLFCHATLLQVAIILITHAIQDFWLWKTIGDGKHMSGIEGGIVIVQDNTLHMLLNYLVLGMKII